MNAIHVHLILTHLPLVGTAFVLALLVVARLRKSRELERITLFFAVIATVLAVPLYLTGEPAEDAAEKLAGVRASLIERHEDAAQWAFGAQVLLGVAALAGLLVFRRSTILPNWFSRPLLAVTVAACGLMAWTANLGGHIRHPEIRPAELNAPSVEKPGADGGTHARATEREGGGR